MAQKSRDTWAWWVGNRNVTQTVKKKHAASVVGKKRREHVRKNGQQRKNLIGYNFLSDICIKYHSLDKFCPYISWTVLYVFIVFCLLNANGINGQQRKNLIGYNFLPNIRVKYHSLDRFYPYISWTVLYEFIIFCLLDANGINVFYMFL